MKPPRQAVEDLLHGRHADPFSLLGTHAGPQGTFARVLIPGADGTPAAPGHVGIVAGYTPTTTASGRPGRDLWLVQAPGYQNLPVELTEATEWSGQIVAVRHIA